VLLKVLRSQGIPLSVGHSIIATDELHQHGLHAAIRELGLEWHVIFNKGSVMALPADVTKATGLLEALAALGLTATETVGIGDAENDQAFLRICGLAAAVGNALPAVKAMSDVVTPAARGAGVRELIELLLRGTLHSVEPRSRDANPGVHTEATGADD
jgi:hydroxymethylpyrimidine pyrophosphatase-like HAD family hydrolase